jgi:hypothetical protein
MRARYVLGEDGRAILDNSVVGAAAVVDKHRLHAGKFRRPQGAEDRTRELIADARETGCVSCRRELKLRLHLILKWDFRTRASVGRHY